MNQSLCILEGTSSHWFLSTPGHFCLEGSDTPTPCPAGTYQDETGQVDCKTCPAGFYCDDSLGPVIIYNATECPTG